MIASRYKNYAHLSDYIEVNSTPTQTTIIAGFRLKRRYCFVNRFVIVVNTFLKINLNPKPCWYEPVYKEVEAIRIVVTPDDFPSSWDGDCELVFGVDERK